MTTGRHLLPFRLPPSTPKLRHIAAPVFAVAADAHVDSVHAAAAIADVWLPPSVPWGC